MPYQLAQVNIGRMLAPLDDPLMAGFVAQLDTINALADASPGFVWRLQTPEGDATSLRPFEDEWLIVNMSVWSSLEHLADFTYRSAHRPVMAQRRQWFSRLDGPFMALWWVRAGHLPNVTEARDRLDHLQVHGETPRAFSFKRPYPAPDAVSEATLPVLAECLP